METLKKLERISNEIHILLDKKFKNTQILLNLFIFMFIVLPFNKGASLLVLLSCLIYFYFKVYLINKEIKSLKKNRNDLIT